MIIDTNKIEMLLNDSSVSYDRITAETGISKGAIYPYRSGKRPLTAMTIDVAIKLQKLYEATQKEEELEMVKITGIKKAVGEFNNWKEQARIYFDKSDLTVWTNIYPGGNESWDEYHDSAIVEVLSKGFPGTQTTTMRELQKLCEDALNEGH